ncbi:MAG TPA: hypothetical protein VK250_07015 [Nitrososphaeraceae archaeon]|nr:hypothetical protein [Nitrososphaeraceae archaeon]
MLEDITLSSLYLIETKMWISNDGTVFSHFLGNTGFIKEIHINTMTLLLPLTLWRYYVTVYYNNSD